MRRVAIFVALLCSLGFGATIKVAAAANMSYALPKLIEAFRRHHPQITIQTIIASSGKLTAQIERGAPFDIFLSADMAYPKRLYQEGKALTRPLVYAKGALVFISTKIDSLAKLPTLSRIAIANPKTAPYGKAAKEALERMGLYEKVRSKLIFGESVAQTFFYATKVADGGFVAKSALFSPEGKRWRKFAIAVDRRYYTPIAQGAILLHGAAKEARTFFCFLFTSEAADILRNFGYVIDD